MRSNTLTIDNEIVEVVILTCLFFAFLVCAVIYFVVLYRNRQLKNQKEQDEREAVFRQELLQTQVEVQEQTFENVSQEIHDNITQVLSFVKLSLATVNNATESDRRLKINECRELLANTISDLRDLSKSLSFEHIASLGLSKTVGMEVERMNKSDIIKATLEINGEPYPLGEQRELVLFRIFQETLNNALKHAGAKHFKILLEYHSDLFILSLEDDGSGFSPQVPDNKTGSGLRNMVNRATLIGGNATIDSKPGEGCRVTVKLNPVKPQFYSDGRPHPDRIS
ncbi:MAG TPA: ATP-binding protein [Mucilaginibacter sp.]|nr:ATP-binding protein [Mucilaginibacter sp.]